MNWLEWSSYGLLAVNVGLQAASMTFLRRWSVGETAPDLTFDYPGLSVVTSLKGLTPQTEGGLLCVLESDYPGPLEFVIVVSDENDPALAFAKSVVERSRAPARVSVRWVSGFSWQHVGGVRALNPRSAKMAAGIQAAEHEWIYWHAVDSWISRDHLRDAMNRTLAQPGRYVTSFPVITQPRELGATLEAAALNIEVARYFLLTTAQVTGRESGHVAYGGSLLAHRSLLERSGGLSRTLNRLTDDVILARQFGGQGAVCALSPKAVYVPQERESVGEFVQRQVRWLMIARYEMPPMFFSALPFMFAPIGLLIALALLNGGDGAGAARVLLSSLAYLVLRAAEGIWFQRELGTPRADWVKGAALAIYDLLLPALWLTALFKARLDWAGDTLLVGPGGELRSATAFVPQQQEVT